MAPSCLLRHEDKKRAERSTIVIVCLDIFKMVSRWLHYITKTKIECLKILPLHSLGIKKYIGLDKDGRFDIVVACKLHVREITG